MAHAAHYEARDLRMALELYGAIMASHPGTKEAGYSRSQIRNIVKELVPERELVGVELSLALSYLDQRETPDAKVDPVAPPVPMEAAR